MNAILWASAGVIILLVGIGAGIWIGRSGIGGSKARIQKAESELEDYKRSVTEHFGQTAAHFQAIGQQYRELYEHMSDGAQALCEPGETGQQLLFAPGAEPVSSAVVEPAAETPVEAVARPPADYVETPDQTDTADEPKSAEDLVTEHAAETADDVDSLSSDEPDEPVAEAVTDSPPETQTKEGEHTLH